MSSPYSFKPGGALKLKGEKNKKRKSSTSSSLRSSAAEGSKRHPLAKEENLETPKSSFVYGTTKAEQKFEEIQRKRLHEQARREARKSHKEKVDTFNKYLDSLSEHHDMPRIGPG